jgi:flagellar motor protein MotB
VRNERYAILINKGFTGIVPVCSAYYIHVAEYDPVAKNDTPEMLQKNRRTDVMLIDKSLTSEMTEISK